MRIIRKQKQIKEVDVIIEDKNICDKCGKEIHNDSYDAFECNVIYRTGDSYPEGGSGEKQEVELCKECAVDLILLLKQNGYNVIYSEWDH